MLIPDIQLFWESTRSDWQDTGYILGFFGKKPAIARNIYEDFVKKGIADGQEAGTCWGRID